MTAAGVQSSPPEAVPAPLADRPAVASLRLAWLYLLSRRAPAALGLLAGLGALLWAALHEVAALDHRDPQVVTPRQLPKGQRLKLLPED